MDETDKKVIEFLKKICPGDFKGGTICYVSMDKEGKAHTGTAIIGNLNPIDLLGISSNMMALSSNIFGCLSTALAQLTSNKRDVSDEDCANAGAAILVAAEMAHQSLKEGGDHINYMDGIK